MFVVDRQGRSYVAGAKVVISGPVTLEAKTDLEGKWVFADVAPGAYSVIVQFPGLELKDAQVVTVEAGRVKNVPLELRPEAVKSSLDVTAGGAESQPSTTAKTIPSEIVRDAPNANERTENVLPLIPGVVRGPDGRINMKGARTTQSGALVNGANATDPSTGAPSLDLPIDVVASVQVISNPYDPEYGKLTGAVTTIDTKTSNFDNFHFSVQNLLPRARVRGGTIDGIGAITPRMTFTGPLVKRRVAFTQSIEYRLVRTPVNSLPPFQRDTTLEGVNSYTQMDLNISAKQNATISLAVYPQKLQYLGLNTFTPQTSSADYHQRGHQLYAQHRYIIDKESVLTSQVSYKTFDADITPNGTGPYQLQVETTEGQYFNLQTRRSWRIDWQETFQAKPKHFWGTHQLKAGLNYAYSSYKSQQTFLPVEVEGISGLPIELVTFTAPQWSSVGQHEVSWFVGDQWALTKRLTVSPGVRFDHDSITDSTHAAPRAGFVLSLTGDGKTLLRAGAGMFYDRVPLMLPSFPFLPGRTVSILGPTGEVVSSTTYVNEIDGQLHNPRSTAWNVGMSRELRKGLVVQVAYEQRVTTNDSILSPTACTGQCVLLLSNGGGQSYKELQVSGRYQFRGDTLNAAYVHSRAHGDLNDFFQFYGNLPKAIVQPNGQGRLPFDGPNRVLLWGEFKLVWKLSAIPVFDLHTGFPYSVEDEYRQYVGPRNTQQFPRFSSTDIQVLRPFSIHVHGYHLKGRIGFSVFNLFNHDNPRDVQNIIESSRYGEFFNPAWREYRGKLVFQF